MSQDTGEIFIYTDGACSGNPGPGGWGAILVSISQNKVKELGGGENPTTNNRMEMTAALEALRSLKTPPKFLRIYTDSTYLIRGVTQWAWGWRKNNWKTSQGDEVSNRDLWEALTAVLGRFKETEIHWSYVRGHQGTPGNERCDEIAVAFSKEDHWNLYQGSLDRYDIDVKTLPPEQVLPAMKPSGEKKSAYSYLSVLDGKLQRHKDWTSCERRVKGRSGARFKKAMDALQEKEILASWGFDPDQAPPED